MSSEDMTVMPKEGSRTYRIWAAADEILANGGRPTAQLIVNALGADFMVSPATIRTQLTRWRHHHGLAKPRVAKEA